MEKRFLPHETESTRRSRREETSHVALGRLESFLSPSSQIQCSATVQKCMRAPPAHLHRPYARFRDSPPVRAPATPRTHPPMVAAAGERRPSRTRAPSPAAEVLAGIVAGSRVPEERCCMGSMVDAWRRMKLPKLVPAMRNYFWQRHGLRPGRRGHGDMAEATGEGRPRWGWMVDVRLRDYGRLCSHPTPILLRAMSL
jgi:hypothetical protein